MRPGLYVLGACLALVLALLGGVELYLRATIHPPPDSERHPFLHHPLARLRVELTRDLPGISRRTVEFSSNALGPSV